MKYIFLFLSFCCSVSEAISQDTIVPANHPPAVNMELNKARIEPYDSLESFCKKNTDRHVGQTIFLKENNYYKSLGYSLIPLFTQPFYGHRKDENEIIYKPVTGKNDIAYSDYNQIKNKFFYVNRIIHQINPESPGQKENFCLELIEKQSNDTVYLQVNRYANEYDNFLTIGYFEKLKQTNIGKEFLFLGNDKYNENNLRDLASGSIRYDIPAGAKLKCIDYLLPDSANNHIIAIFNHSDYGKLFVFCHHGGWNKLVPREDYDARNSKNKQLVKKYGRKDAERIRDGFVAIGFTKQMCLESWGEPDKINITKSNNGSGADWGTKRKFGTIEEWIYSGTFSNGYLYFENDVLTRMQN